MILNECLPLACLWPASGLPLALSLNVSYLAKSLSGERVGLAAGGQYELLDV